MFFISPAEIFAQMQEQYYYKARVEKIQQEGKRTIGSSQNIFQKITVRILEGPHKNKTVTIEHGGNFTITNEQKVTVGETLILRESVGPDTKNSYSVADSYRLPNMLWILVGFFIVVILIAGKKGIGAIAGMLISIAIIMWYIIPQILNGADPLFISITGSVVILVATMYLAHGITKQTTIAISATGISLVLTAAFAIFFVSLTKLSGLGSEDSYTLLQGFGSLINFRGLLLGGIIIGTLGVLDDVTTTQAATIHELSESNHKLTFEQLIFKGMKIGREHIASVINTLVLAYAGASIGVFIFLHLGIQQQTQPLWVILNSEVIVEEIIRTLAGSLGLILAVPITTLLAAFFAKHEIRIS